VFLRKTVVSKKRLLQREMDVYAQFCTRRPPSELVSDRSRSDELQQWVVDHLKDEFQYATGISILDAASSIARSQIDNGYETAEEPEPEPESESGTENPPKRLDWDRDLPEFFEGEPTEDWRIEEALREEEL
jgi:hypothetical protein